MSNVIIRKSFLEYLKLIYYKITNKEGCDFALTGKHFKNLLFQILNQNNTFISNLELNDTDNYFLISCVDGSKFSLSIQETVTRFVIDPNINKKSIQKQLNSYIENHTKTDFLSEIEWLAHNNPYIFQILLVVLKLLELHIISYQLAEDIMIQIRPYAQELKEEWNNLH